jgi:hypothetical protein
MWEPNYMFYLTIICQIVVTLIIVPRLIKGKLLKSLAPYLNEQNQTLKVSLETNLKRTIKNYMNLCNLFTLIGLAIVVYAWYNKTELLNWDNQASIGVLSLMSVSTIGFVAIGLSKCRKLSLQFSKGIRTASLTVKPWQDYLPKILMYTLIASQIALISSIIYYMFNPFDGFGGAANFIGIAVINTIFILANYKILTRNSWPVGISEQQKQLTKTRGVHINFTVWLMASLYLMISLWLAASGLKDIQLLSQSIYIMLILLWDTIF